jgi:ribosomal protein S18 acetylase RimI-like enzyme
MPPDVRIRRMQPKDLDRVIEIYNEIFDTPYVSFAELDEGKADGPAGPFDQAPAVFRAELREMMEQTEALLLVAIDGDEIAGFGRANLRRARAGHLECWLHDIGVSPAHRRRGIGHALIEPLVEWGQQAGSKYILLETGAGNSAGQETFRKIGFTPLATVLWRGTD